MLYYVVDEWEWCNKNDKDRIDVGIRFFLLLFLQFLFGLLFVLISTDDGSRYFKHYNNRKNLMMYK